MAIKYVEEPLPAQQKLGFNINSFYGVNNTGTAANGEFVTCKNMTSDCYPYASPRNPREVITSGIENPQKVLFCGDRLSYIAGGKLNVKGGESFENIGDVGTVTSAVDFNNQKMLFYPSHIEYNYENSTLTEVSKNLELVKGSFDSNDAFSNNCDDVELQYRSSSFDYKKGATFVIKGETDGYFITPTAVMEKDAVKRDEKGNVVYTTVTINVAGNNSNWKTNGYVTNGNYGMKLFVRAWYTDKDGKEQELTKKTSNYSVDYKEVNFGEPIMFNGITPSKLLVQVGYFLHQLTGLNCVYDEKCQKQRNNDLKNPEFKLWITSTEYPAPNSMPAISYACMDNNRVVAVQGNNFYASCLGDYADWTDFTDAEGNPKETGAYAEELYTYGDFTGIIKYNNSVILTKADLTYICYGNKPPYRIQEACNSGCISNNTIAEVDGYIYWLGRDGIYMFGGSVPRCISDNLNVTLTDAVACGFEHKYYICGNDGESYKLYVYDTQRNLWHIEDERQYVSLATKDGALYGLTADGEILKFNAGNERVEWEFTTSDFDFGTEYTKNLAKIYVRMKLYEQAYVDLYVRTNRQEWYKFANFQADGTSVIQAKAKLKKCDYFTLRFVGCGKAEIMDVYADVTLGSQKHRSGDKLAVFRKM